MRLKLLLLILTFFTCAFTFVQKDITVSGTVIDTEYKTPLEYATISFISKKDNKIIPGGITNEKGMFSIEVPAGTYTV